MQKKGREREETVRERERKEKVIGGFRTVVCPKKKKEKRLLRQSVNICELVKRDQTSL